MKNYMVHHILIALVLQTVLVILTGNIYFATLIPAVFYTGREIWQYKYKFINKRFDWDGFIPTVIALIITMLGQL